MMKIFKCFVLCGFCLSFAACQTVTLSPQGKSIKYEEPPTYQKSYPFYLHGLIGKAKVNAKKICGSKKAVQMQTQRTFMDSFWSWLIGGAVTLTTVSILFNPFITGSLWASLITYWPLSVSTSMLSYSIYTPKTAKVWCR